MASIALASCRKIVLCFLWPLVHDRSEQSVSINSTDPKEIFVALMAPADTFADPAFCPLIFSTKAHEIFRGKSACCHGRSVWCSVPCIPSKRGVESKMTRWFVRPRLRRTKGERRPVLTPHFSGTQSVPCRVALSHLRGNVDRFGPPTSNLQNGRKQRLLLRFGLPRVRQHYTVHRLAGATVECGITCPMAQQTGQRGMRSVVKKAASVAPREASLTF